MAAFSTAPQVQTLVWELRSHIMPLHMVPRPPDEGREERKKERQEKQDSMQMAGMLMVEILALHCVYPGGTWGGEGHSRVGMQKGFSGFKAKKQLQES